MLVRQPIAAGRFYPGQGNALKNEVNDWIRKGKEKQNQPGNNADACTNIPWALMLPHAGYIFCGNVIGQTFAGQTLPQRMIVLCPNHTGVGKMLGVWPTGAWLTPLGPVEVDHKLAEEILKSGGGFEADTMSHIGEHSIEVILPFLQETVKNPLIVPITVGTHDNRILQNAGKALAKILQQKDNNNVGLIISSDMNHYENQRVTIAKDELALAKACAADPDGLLRTTNIEHITMCGAAPLALALYAAHDLGGVKVELAAHDTSASASGDFDHTVGYAGLRLFLDKKQNDSAQADS